MKDRWEFEVIDRPTGPGETISEWMDDEGDVIRESHDGRPGRQDRGHQGHRHRGRH
jgi:hypothetical protein